MGNNDNNNNNEPVQVRESYPRVIFMKYIAVYLLE